MERAEAATVQVHRAVVDAEGNLRLPAALLQELACDAGDELLFMVRSNGQIHVSSLAGRLRRVTGIFAHLAPDRILSEEVIQERRDERGQA